MEVALFSTGPLSRSDGIEGSRRGAGQPSYPSCDDQRGSEDCGEDTGVEYAE